MLYLSTKKDTSASKAGLSIPHKDHALLHNCDDLARKCTHSQPLCRQQPQTLSVDRLATRASCILLDLQIRVRPCEKSKTLEATLLERDRPQTKLFRLETRKSCFRLAAVQHVA